MSIVLRKTYRKQKLNEILQTSSTIASKYEIFRSEYNEIHASSFIIFIPKYFIEICEVVSVLFKTSKFC